MLRGAWGTASMVCVWKEIPVRQRLASAHLGMKIKMVKKKKKKIYFFSDQKGPEKYFG